VKKLLLGLALVAPGIAHAACCYFSAKDKDINQPGQKAFITWVESEKIESFTVQPKFEGNALDFGMVVPTPSKPKLDEMPRDFFKDLAIYTILMPLPQPIWLEEPVINFAGVEESDHNEKADGETHKGDHGVKVLESGVVGSLDYKIIVAEDASGLYAWLKENGYSFGGTEETLDFYIKKKWFFTVMKIDSKAMKKNPDGSYLGEVTPTRFTFESDQCVYPLKITQISVKDKTEALFYVQAPYKVDLTGDNSYQYTWVPMLQAASGCTPGGLPGRGGQWLEAFKAQTPALLQRAAVLDYRFVAGQRPQPNNKGHIPTTMEWARKLSDENIKVLAGKAPYSEKVPDVDEGFTQADLKDPKRAQAVIKVIQARLNKAQQERPIGYLVREAPQDDVRNLQQLAGHLQAGLFITKFRKIFARDEMNDDLVMVPARYNDADDDSEYEELLPVSPP
jgi:hypothetical protein